MQVIRTYKYTMARKLIRMFVAFVVFIGLMVFAAVSFAVEKPPQTLLQHISSHPVVHDKQCDVKSLKLTNVECLIFFDEKHDVVWVVLFDDQLDITHIIASKGGQEAHVWCRSTICV